MKLDPREFAMVCLGCNHWQIDVRPGAISDLGGVRAAVVAMAEVHVEHIYSDCPNGPDGRAQVGGRWYEAPKMADGKAATATMAGYPFPRWWRVA